MPMSWPGTVSHSDEGKRVMASISKLPNGRRTIQFVSPDGKRRSIRLGKVSQRVAEKAKGYIEELANCVQTGLPQSHELTLWLQDVDGEFYDRLVRGGLVPERAKTKLGPFLQQCVDNRQDVKPATKEVWRQVIANLVTFFGADRDLRSLTAGDAEDFKQYLIGRGLAGTTISKRLQFSRQFFRMAIKREVIRENPFAECRHASSVNLEERHYVAYEEINRLMESANPEWQLIIALVRFAACGVHQKS